MSNVALGIIGFFELTLARVTYYPALTGAHESQGKEPLAVRKRGKKKVFETNRGDLDG